MLYSVKTLIYIEIDRNDLEVLVVGGPNFGDKINE